MGFVENLVTWPKNVLRGNERLGNWLPRESLNTRREGVKNEVGALMAEVYPRARCPASYLQFESETDIKKNGFSTFQIK